MIKINEIDPEKSTIEYTPPNGPRTILHIPMGHDQLISFFNVLTEVAHKGPMVIGSVLPQLDANGRAVICLTKVPKSQG